MATSHGILMRRYAPSPALGRHQVLDARSLAYLHRHRGETLAPVTWAPTVPVLDQQNLLSQGIRTSRIVPGMAEDLDAVASCTANAAATALSVLLGAEGPAKIGLSATEAPSCQEWTLCLYAEATRLDEFTSAAWPPTDGGSSGLGVARALHRRGLVGSYRHALDADALANALTGGPVLLGLPWFQGWFSPGADGFVDSVPYWRTSGIAGGHEVCALGLEAVVQDHAGRILPERTVLRLRNSWGPGWGRDGDFFLRLSTYNLLRRQIDAVQLHA